MTSDTYWETKLDGLKLGGKSMTTTTKVILDSGTSILAGPSADVKAIAAAAGAKARVPRPGVAAAFPPAGAWPPEDVPAVQHAAGPVA